MKRLTCLLLLLLPLGLMASATDPIDTAVELIKGGNAKELAKIFAPSVELGLLGDEDIVNPAQAEVALNAFFKAHAVKLVTVVHKVNSNASVKYGVLSLVTTSGTYRTTVSLKLVKDHFLINEFKVEDKK